MTGPQDPFAHNVFGGDPFAGQPPDSGPPVFGTPAAPAPQPQPANRLATLSVIFAFVFAPAGAVLGHLGLSEIRRTGETGRRRAITGLIASYTIIVAVIAAVTGIALTRHRLPPPAAGAITPAQPHVAPADLPGLLTTPIGLDGVKPQQTLTSLTPLAGAIDPAACLGVLSIGDPRVYTAPAVRGFHRTDYRITEPQGYAEFDQSAAAYDTIADAQTALHNLTDGWRACTAATDPAVHQYRFDSPLPFRSDGSQDWGRPAINAPLQFELHNIAVAKANVVVEVLLVDNISNQCDPVKTVDAILDRIPG